MKLFLSLFIIFSSVLSFSQDICHAQSEPERMGQGVIMLEDFQKDTVGHFPYGWYDRDGNAMLYNHTPEEQAQYKYRIKSEGRNKFLHYQGTRAMHINFPLVNKEKENIYNINIYETPILSWKVRAKNLPNNADETSDELNDSVASIYVVFDMGRIALFKKVPKSIRYSWSTTLQKGTRDSKLFGNQQIHIIKSGTEDTGKWITFQRNLVEDYRNFFGDDPPKTPLAILILSDGNSTNSYVEADYDSIKLMPAQ